MLTERQAAAAEDLRSDWEFGLAGARDPEMAGTGGGVGGYSVAQIDAATRYREAVQAIGKRQSAIVLPIVIGTADGGEITAEMLAKRIAASEGAKPNVQRVLGVLAVALDTLGDHYARCRDPRRAAKYG